ncbi:MAG TPA: hypothetical protein VFA82_03605 [Gaiellaceae bacterium]|nr:hypothetical protein [Gaiellaceae bacterium]
MSEHTDRLRANADALPPPPAAMEPYLAKVRTLARTVTDEDVAALKAAGIEEDVIFEQTVGAAIREGLRRLEAAERVIG